MNSKISNIRKVLSVFYDIWSIREKLLPTKTICQYKIFIFNKILCDMWYKINTSKLTEVSIIHQSILLATSERTAYANELFRNVVNCENSRLFRILRKTGIYSQLRQFIFLYFVRTSMNTYTWEVKLAIHLPLFTLSLLIKPSEIFWKCSLLSEILETQQYTRKLYYCNFWAILEKTGSVWPIEINYQIREHENENLKFSIWLSKEIYCIHLDFCSRKPRNHIYRLLYNLQ